MLFYYIYRLVLTFLIFFRISFYYFYLTIGSYFLPSVRQTKQQKIAVCLRRSFEFLGATYIKLGQIMSMRPDYFAQEICDELYKLFDKAKPLKFPIIHKIIKERLKEKVSLFESIEPVPIGSASFAQV